MILLQTNHLSQFAGCAMLVSLGMAHAEVVARFDAGDTTAGSVQSSFVAIGTAGSTPAAYAGPRTVISGLVSLRLTGGANLAGATTKDVSGDFNSTGNLLSRNRNTPAADVGSFTYSDIYRDFVTANVLGIQLSGLAASSNYAVTFYTYDNSGNRTQTFTDVTPGGTGDTGTVTYTAASSFTAGTANDIFTTTLNAASDANGRLFFTETGVGTAGSTSVAVLGGDGRGRCFRITLVRRLPPCL